jgi:hypothetical protein
VADVTRVLKRRGATRAAPSVDRLFGDLLPLLDEAMRAIFVGEQGAVDRCRKERRVKFYRDIGLRVLVDLFPANANFAAVVGHDPVVNAASLRMQDKPHLALM